LDPLKEVFMVLGLTRVDFENSSWNGFQFVGHFVGGLAVAGAIKGLAHKLFGLKKGSTASSVACTLSFAAGTGFSVVYLAPRSNLVATTWGKVAKLVGMHVIAMFAVNKAVEGSGLLLVPPLMGSLSGGVGRYSLYTAGVLGALLGIDDDSPKNNKRS
jgi:hypothetical protein